MGKSADYYAANPEARKKKQAYAKKYNASPEQREYRADLAKERRKRGIMSKGGPDVSHKKDGSTTLEDPKKNRARQGANGKSTKK